MCLIDLDQVTIEVNLSKKKIYRACIWLSDQKWPTKVETLKNGEQFAERRSQDFYIWEDDQLLCYSTSITKLWLQHFAL